MSTPRGRASPACFVVRYGTMLALLVAGGVPPRSVRAADAPPAPTAFPSLKLSDKPPPGCCCIAVGSPKAGDCSFGVQEDKCLTAGTLFPERRTTWTAGRCPVR
jgi:hypothetical protein